MWAALVAHRTPALRLSGRIPGGAGIIHEVHLPVGDSGHLREPSCCSIVDRIVRWIIDAPAPSSGQASVKLGRDELLGGLFAFLLALTHLLIFNIQTRGTVSTLSGNFFTSYYGVNNLAFFDNLIQRLKQFQTVLRGDHFWYLGETLRQPTLAAGPGRLSGPGMSGGPSCAGDPQRCRLAKGALSPTCGHHPDHSAKLFHHLGPVVHALRHIDAVAGSGVGRWAGIHHPDAPANHTCGGLRF